jgi:LmbE family N-acetylglucosaminyl deacetylase
MSIFGKCAVIVAHPDDETLWMGGIMLMHPDCQWTVVTVCRKSDPDRSARFFKALREFNAGGAMGDLDDGAEQVPLSSRKVQDAILGLLQSDRFDSIFTHSLWGEYTRHLRHEETGKAVLALRRSGTLHCRELFTFAYEDGGGKYLPRPIRNTGSLIKLPEHIWQRKYEIITNIYGFAPDTFEARTTPKQEAFWQFGGTKNEPGESHKFQEN